MIDQFENLFRGVHVPVLPIETLPVEPPSRIRCTSDDCRHFVIMEAFRLIFPLCRVMFGPGKASGKHRVGDSFALSSHCRIVVTPVVEIA
jgi:hypothetical protein